MLTKSLKIPDNTETEFFKLIFFQSQQKDMTKILPRNFKERFGAFNMLTAHKYSNTSLFTLLSNPAFWSLEYQKNNLWGSSFFRRYSKLYLDLGNTEKNRKFFFRVLDNCIWIGCGKHSLLPRENTFHRVSICYQTVSRFQILLRQNSLSSFYFRVIKERIWQKYYRADLRSVLEPWTCWLPEVFWHGAF